MHVYTVGDGLSEGEINILHAIVTKKRLVIGGGMMLLAKLRMELFKKKSRKYGITISIAYSVFL